MKRLDRYGNQIIPFLLNWFYCARCKNTKSNPKNLTQYMYQDSKLLAHNPFEQFYGQFGQSNTPCILDFCPCSTRKETFVNLLFTQILSLKFSFLSEFDRNYYVTLQKAVILCMLQMQQIQGTTLKGFSAALTSLAQCQLHSMYLDSKLTTFVTRTS